MRYHDIKIDHDQPIPEPRNGNSMTSLFRKLSVGDSILLPGTVRASSFHSIATAVGIKITYRAQDNGRSYRVWRVK